MKRPVVCVTRNGVTTRNMGGGFPPMQGDRAMTGLSDVAQEKAALRKAQIEKRDAIARPMRLLAGHAVMGEPYWSILSAHLPKPAV